MARGQVKAVALSAHHPVAVEVEAGPVVDLAATSAQVFGKSCYSSFDN